MTTEVPGSPAPSFLLRRLTLRVLFALSVLESLAIVVLGWLCRQHYNIEWAGKSS